MADMVPLSQTLAAVTFMGSGRFGPTVTALMGLLAVLLGVRARVRARGQSDPTSGLGARSPAALVLGVASAILGGIFLVAADGGPGTGNGVVASAAAIVLGVLAVGLDRRIALTQVSTTGPGGRAR